MLFTSSNVVDIEKYFYKTYIKFKEFGDKLFFIQSISSTCITGKDQNGTLFELYLSDEFPYEVDYILPHKAVFQYKKDSYLLQRIPARQYRRGLCDQNTSLVNISNGETMGISFENLSAFVTKQRYFKFYEVIDGNLGYNSYALSSRMSFSGRRLYCDIVSIGKYSISGKYLEVLSPFADIIRAMIKANGESLEVVNV